MGSTILLLGLILVGSFPTSLEAQVGRRLREAAARAAERETTRQIERKVENTIRCAVDDRDCISKAEREGKQVEVVDRQGNPVPQPAPAAAPAPAAPSAAAGTAAEDEAARAERQARAEREAQEYLAAMMAARAPAPARIPDPERGILEMTDEVLVRFAATLRAEAAALKEIERTFTPQRMEAFDRCLEKLDADPKFTSLRDRAYERQERVQDEETQRLEREVRDYALNECGPGPHGPSAPGPYAHGAPSEPGPYAHAAWSEPNMPGPNVPPEVGSPGSPGDGNGGAFAGFSSKQYSHLKERVPPYCQSSGGSTGDYVYTDVERSALNKHCPTLMPLLSAIQ